VLVDEQATPEQIAIFRRMTQWERWRAARDLIKLIVVVGIALAMTGCDSGTIDPNLIEEARVRGQANNERRLGTGLRIIGNTWRGYPALFRDEWDCRDTWYFKGERTDPRAKVVELNELKQPVKETDFYYSGTRLLSRNAEGNSYWEQVKFISTYNTTTTVLLYLGEDSETAAWVKAATDDGSLKVAIVTLEKIRRKWGLKGSETFPEDGPEARWWSVFP